MYRFLTVLLVIAGVALAQAPNKPALDFRLVDTTGKVVRLSGFRGKKPVVVNFWATWCEVCAEELPKLNEVFKRSSGKYAFLAVHADPSVPTDEVRAHAQDQRWVFPVLVNAPKGTKDVDSLRAVTSRYGVTGTPSFFFVDRQGVLKVAHVGALDAVTYQRYLGLIGAN
jgi:thiol-disulfide isomerase/thioredoxin